MIKFYILDDDHNPVEASMECSANWRAKPSNSRVARTDVGPLGSFYVDRWQAIKERYYSEVSTVALSIDMSFGLGGPPLLFETMVFGGESDQLCHRYHSWDAAIKGHAEVVEIVQGVFDMKQKELIDWGNANVKRRFHSDIRGDRYECPHCEAFIDRKTNPKYPMRMIAHRHNCTWGQAWQAHRKKVDPV